MPMTRTPLDRHWLRGFSRRVVTALRGRDWTRPDGQCRQSPDWLVLGINNVCNLHCKMCHVGLGGSDTVFWANLIGDSPHDMSVDLLQEILTQARAFWPRPGIGLAFTEPLIHPRILEIARAIVEQGFYCAITTNGMMLPRLADALVDIGVHDLTLSADGPAPVHNRIRGGRNSFERLYQGVELVNAAKARGDRRYPLVRFSFTTTDHNCGDVLAFVQAVEPLRPVSINISQLNFITAEMAQAHNAAYPSVAVTRSNLGTMDPAAFDTAGLWAELERVRAYARTRGEAFPLLSLAPNPANREALTQYYHDPLTFVGGRQCTDPWRMMMIKTDGSVIPSHGRCYNYTIGNVESEPLSSLWNNDRFREFRQMLRQGGGTLPACARCCGVVGKPAPGTS